MHSIRVQDVVRLCGGKLLNGREDLVLNNFSTDTRKINKGDVYVGIVGEKFDGNDFYEDAIKKGANCLILSKEPKGYDKDVTIVIVEDTLKCLQELAKYKRSLYDIPVIAITGSSGKTSTKDIIYSVVSKKYKTCKTQGNYNNHLGVPLTILSLKDDDEVLVVELGMNHFGEISLLSSISRPTISIITNIGTSHIDNLGSMEGIRQAKLEILDGMIGRDVIINGDDKMLLEVLDELKNNYNVRTISIDNDGDYKGIHIKENVFSSKFDIASKLKDITVNVGGKVYVYNAIVAYTVGKMLDIRDNDIKEGIQEFKLSAHRLENKIMTNGAIVIDDTYNATPEAVSSSISLLSRVKERRRILVFGNMFGLGEHTEELHINLGSDVVDSNVDILVTIGEYAKLVGDKAISLGMNKDNVINFKEEMDSYQFLDKLIKPNDIILVKGSHAMNMVNIVNHLVK